MRRSGKRCTALAATAALVVAALPAAPAAAGGPERGRGWAFVDRRAAEVDPLWRPSVGSYRTRDGRYGTRVAASMLAVHASEAVAGHVGPARHDDRIAPLVEILTRYPAFVEHV